MLNTISKVRNVLSAVKTTHDAAKRLVNWQNETMQTTALQNMFKTYKPQQLEALIANKDELRKYMYEFESGIHKIIAELGVLPYNQELVELSTALSVTMLVQHFEGVAKLMKEHDLSYPVASAFQYVRLRAGTSSPAMELVTA